MKKTTLVLLLLSIATINVLSQEIKANVIVNLDQLDFEARNQVTNIKNDLEKYINNQRFTDLDWEGDPIPVDMTIFLTGGNNNRYSAKMMIISYRYLDGYENGRSPTLKIFEQNWNFEYGLGANLSFNPYVYNPITTIIDFYMSLVIGFDLDTYEEVGQGANQVFDQAEALIRLGASQNAPGFDTFTQPGQFNKFNLASELTDLRYYDLRKLFFAYYYDGLDQMAYDKKKAKENLANVIADMAYFKRNKLTGPSVLMQAFFDTKNEELAAIFNGHNNKQVFNDLRYLDPTNSVIYNDSEEGKIGTGNQW